MLVIIEDICNNELLLTSNDSDTDSFYSVKLKI